MAKLHTKSVGEITFECYSERGIMSFLMFRYLPYGNNLNLFLEELEFPQNLPNPFKGESVENPVFFSELDFGNIGYGKPDGAIFFLLKDNPSMVFIEGKFNESYEESFKNKSYNSTIKGQLELRWRAISLYKNHLNEAVIPHRNKNFNYLKETKAYRIFYQSNDTFYKNLKSKSLNRIASFRRLRLLEGVKNIFEKYVNRCTMQNIYFLTTTLEENNPFDNITKCKLPQLFGLTWQKAKGHFCWISTSKIIMMCKMECM